MADAPPESDSRSDSRPRRDHDRRRHRRENSVFDVLSQCKQILRFNECKFQAADEEMTSSTEGTFYAAQKTAASLYAHQTYVPPPSEPKHDRQLYIGNIPFGISCTKLVEELNLALLAMGKHSCQLGNPILSCWISQDGHFAFLEFRTVADVHEGFALG